MQEVLKKTITVFGEDPMRYFRIPGIVVSARGTIVLCFEMRTGPSDWSAYGVGVVRSTDQGESWSPVVRQAAPAPGSAVNNPLLIACKDGRILLMWEEDYCRGYLKVSHDDGETFGETREITADIAAFREKTGYPWDVFAFGPGHGTELSDGTLLVPMWYANGGARSHHPSVVSAIKSFDGGKTWQVGECIGDDAVIRNPNETCAVELSDGRILLNIRHEGREKYRAVTCSADGLHNFSPPVLDRNLPDPICFGSMARCPVTVQGGHPIVFSNCAVQPCRHNNYSRKRENLTLRLSLDDCESWAYSRKLEQYSGYSDVAFSPDGEYVYCFYEQEADPVLCSQPRYLTFARVNMDWLCDKRRTIEE